MSVVGSVRLVLVVVGSGFVCSLELLVPLEVFGPVDTSQLFW